MTRMRDLLSDHVYYNGPTAFTAEEVSEQADLFAHRAALFHTASDNIPRGWVVAGSLDDVRLALPTPDYMAFSESCGYAIPRLWVDLFQRATNRIRWTPIRPAHVIITRYDTALLRDDHFAIGAKALRDALKFRTTGRSDGRLLYYFGAIRDDDPRSAEFVYRQETVPDTEAIGMRVEVYPGALSNPPLQRPGCADR